MEENKILSENVEKRSFNKVGRKPFKKATCTKTWRFFIEDVNELLDSGLTPKHVLNLGLKAYRDNPILIERIRSLEVGNERLQKKLTAFSTRLYELDQKK